MSNTKLNDRFRRFAHWTSEVTGSPWAFITAMSVIVVWALVICSNNLLSSPH